MQEINAWLQSTGSYDAGVKLYLQHGKDTLLLRLFQEGYSEFKLQKLRQVLTQLAGGEKASSRPSPKEKAISAQPLPVEESSHVLADLEDVQDQVATLEYDHYDLQSQVNKLEADQKKIQDDVKVLQVAQKTAPRGWPAPMDETVKSLHDQWHPLFLEKKSLQARIYDVALAGQKDPAKKKEAGAMAHRILDLRDACREIYKKRDHYLQYHNLPEEKKPIGVPHDPAKWPITLQNFQRYLRDYKHKLKKQPQNEAFQKQLEKYEWGVAELKRLMKLD